MILLIPGPVTTDARVKAAAAQDYAPWDLEFRAMYARVRGRVLRAAGGVEGVHDCLALPGCGHFALEAAVRTFVPAGGRILLPVTGQYAERIGRLASEAGRVVVRMEVAEGTRVDPAAVEAALRADASIGHLACVYSETSTGICHDVPALAAAAGRAGRRVIVDAVSAFGALPFDISVLPSVDSMSFTSNKCLEGMPGSSFTVAPVERLRACAGSAGSWSFDLSALHMHHVNSGAGSHRFTPAAGTLASFDVALDLWEAEGGQAGRLARYTANMRALVEGAAGLGLRACLEPGLQGPIVVNLVAPAEAGWDLQRFVDGLKGRGFLISNFFNTREPSIRVGCIGAVTPADMRGAVAAMGGVLGEMGVGRLAA